MRYTTIIDIREFPALYRNPNVRLVYLHLVLRSGYHDYDRDLTDVSLRQLAREVGLTLAAVRHALDMLAKHRLVVKEQTQLRIRKFITEQPPSPRAKTKKEAAARAQKEQETRERELRAMERQRQREEQQRILATGKTSFMIYYEEQQAAAARGDLAAAAYVAKHAKTYQNHLQEMSKGGGAADGVRTKEVHTLSQEEALALASSLVPKLELFEDHA